MGDKRRGAKTLTRRVRRLAEDLPAYAARCLTIRTKSGDSAPLTLNAAQRCLEARAADQIARTGKVRLIVLKGRQQGVSTYVQARFFHRTSWRKGLRAFILAHSAPAAESLFAMTARFHGLCPEAVRPATGKANARELTFPGSDSGYRVGTARSEAVGRAETLQLFHGSEVAYWENAEDHMAGVLQAVPPIAGTEIWLESTADGIGNFFHAECVKAIQRNSAFEFVFIPWFWQDEYRIAPGPAATFEPLAEEAELIARYKLEPAQLLWRRAKIAEIGDARFMQEYPTTPEDAFMVAGANVLIGSALLRAAVDRDIAPVPAAVVWGLDPSRFGDDRKALAKRRGNVLLEPVKVLLEGCVADTQALAGAVRHEFEATPLHLRPVAICVDAIGIGAGVADALRAAGLPVRDVNVAESPSARPRFNRLRDELWWKAREWFEDRRCRIPADEDLIVELAAVIYDHTVADRVKVEGKREMKKRLGYSPDKADAFVLTFAAPDTAPRARQVVEGGRLTGPHAWMG